MTRLIPLLLAVALALALCLASSPTTTLATAPQGTFPSNTGNVLTWRASARLSTSLEWAVLQSTAPGAPPLLLDPTLANATTLDQGPSIFVPFYEAAVDPNAVLDVSFAFVTRDTSTLAVQVNPATGLRGVAGVLWDGASSAWERLSTTRARPPPNAGFQVLLLNRGTWSSVAVSFAGEMFYNDEIITPFNPYLMFLRASWATGTVQLTVRGTATTYTFAAPFAPLPQWPCSLSVGTARDGQITGTPNRWETRVDVEIFDFTASVWSSSTPFSGGAVRSAAATPPPTVPYGGYSPFPRAVLFSMLDPPVRFPKEVGIRADTSAVPNSEAVLAGRAPGSQFVRLTFAVTLSAEPWRDWFTPQLLAAGRNAYPAIMCMSKSLSQFSNLPGPYLLRVGVEPNPDATQSSGRLHASLGDGGNGVARAVLVSWPPVHGSTKYQVEFVVEFNAAGAPGTAAIRFAQADAPDLGPFVPLMGTSDPAPPLNVGAWIVPPSGTALRLPVVVGAPCVGVQASSVALANFAFESFNVEYFADWDTYNAALVYERRPQVPAFPGPGVTGVDVSGMAAASRAVPPAPLLPLPGTYAKFLESADAAARPQLAETGFSGVVAALPNPSPKTKAQLLAVRFQGSAWVPAQSSCASWGAAAVNPPVEMPLVSVKGGVMDLFVTCPGRNMVARGWGGALATSNLFVVPPSQWVDFAVTLYAETVSKLELELWVSGVGAARVPVQPTMPVLASWNLTAVWLGRGWGTGWSTPVSVGAWQIRNLEFWVGSTATSAPPSANCAAQTTAKACAALAPLCAWLAGPKSCSPVGGDGLTNTFAPTVGVAWGTAAPTTPTLSPVSAPSPKAPTFRPTPPTTPQPTTLAPTTGAPTTASPTTPQPSSVPSLEPTARPVPTKVKTPKPTVRGATHKPTTSAPTTFPTTGMPTWRPTLATFFPTMGGTGAPSASPTTTPRPTTLATATFFPTSEKPTTVPTPEPTTPGPTAAHAPTTRPTSTPAPTLATFFPTSSAPTTPKPTTSAPTLATFFPTASLPPSPRPTRDPLDTPMPTSEPTRDTPMPTSSPPAPCSVPTATPSPSPPSLSPTRPTFLPPTTGNPSSAPVSRLGAVPPPPSASASGSQVDVVTVAASVAGVVGAVLLIGLSVGCFVAGARKFKRDVQADQAAKAKRRSEGGPSELGGAEPIAVTAVVGAGVGVGVASTPMRRSPKQPQECMVALAASAPAKPPPRRAAPPPTRPTVTFGGADGENDAGRANKTSPADVEMGSAAKPARPASATVGRTPARSTSRRMQPITVSSLAAALQSAPTPAPPARASEPIAALELESGLGGAPAHDSQLSAHYAPPTEMETSDLTAHVLAGQHPDAKRASRPHPLLTAEAPTQADAEAARSRTSKRASATASLAAQLAAMLAPAPAPAQQPRQADSDFDVL